MQSLVDSHCTRAWIDLIAIIYFKFNFIVDGLAFKNILLQRLKKFSYSNFGIFRFKNFCSFAADKFNILKLPEIAQNDDKIKISLYPNKNITIFLRFGSTFLALVL